MKQITVISNLYACQYSLGDLRWYYIIKGHALFVSPGNWSYYVIMSSGSRSWGGLENKRRRIFWDVQYISCDSMCLLPDMHNCGLRMRREWRERFPSKGLQMKPLFRDPDMHQDMCVTHVPWCMSGSLSAGGGENNPGIVWLWVSKYPR